MAATRRQESTPLLAATFSYGTTTSTPAAAPAVAPPATPAAAPAVAPPATPAAAPAATPPATPGWGRWIAGGIYNHVLHPVAHTVYETVRHPLATLKKVAKATPAAITALPAAINAFLSATHTKSEDVNASWWITMAPAKKFHSILNTIASLTANFIMNRGFLVATLVGLKDAFSTCFKSAKNFFGNTGAIFLSILTALTAAAIAYNAFLLFGAAVAVFPATINFVLYFATGFVGMRSIAKKIHDARSPDARFQRECLDKLKHIKSDYLTSINEFLTQQQVNETLLELQQPDLPVARRTELQDKMQSILKTLLQDKLTALATLGEVIKNKTNGELAKEWAATIFDITVATSIFLPFFATFTEAGFRGVEIITKMAGSNALEKIHQAGKIAIGFVPGLLSSLYYAFVTASCRSALIGLMQRLYHHPTEIPGALLFLTFGGLSGTGMENVSSGIVNSNNIFSLTPNSTVSQMYVVLNALGAADVNTTLMLGETYLRQQDVLPGRSLDNLINYFAAEDHPLSPSTVKQLRAVGLFGSSAPPTAPSHQYQRMSDDEEAALPLDATRAAMPAS